MTEDIRTKILGSILTVLVVFYIFNFVIPKKTYITKKEYGDQWAFTVDKIEIKCQHKAVYGVIKEDIYPMNKIAVSRFKNNPNVKNVNDIRLFNDEINAVLEKRANGQPYTKIRKDISFAVAKGLELCD